MDLLNSSLLNMLNIGIIVIDHGFKIVYANNWIQGRLASPLEVTPGTMVTDLGEPSERFLEALYTARDKGRSSLLASKLNKLPFCLVHGGLELSYNLMVSNVVIDGRRNVLVQIIDVTQVKQREQFLMEKQKEVDGERVKAFNKERLVSLGELSSSIAHEINNPLAILQLNYSVMAKMLKKKDILFPEIEEVINEGKQTIERISKLIVSIKNLARDPQGNGFTTATLNKVIQDVLPVMLARAHSEGIEVRYDPTGEAVNASIDCMRTLLGQVFVNLFNNSFYELKKYDTKWIEVSTKLLDDAIEIWFTDSGTGIPLEIREKVFLPFYTTKDIGEGTGLGLSTVHKILESHGGQIRIDTDCPNTRFVITLPKTSKFKEVF